MPEVINNLVYTDIGHKGILLVSDLKDILYKKPTFFYQGGQTFVWETSMDDNLVAMVFYVEEDSAVQDRISIPLVKTNYNSATVDPLSPILSNTTMYERYFLYDNKKRYYLEYIEYAKKDNRALFLTNDRIEIKVVN